MIRKLLVIMLVMAFVPSVFAGTTGKIAGIVQDAQTGEPLPGVNVIIDGTTLGASTDIDGMYFIINVPIGSHNVTVSYIGFKTIKTEGVYIQPDRTTRLNIELEETVLQVGEVIVVEAERDRIEKDLTMSSQYISSEEMIMLPVESFQQAATLQAGAVGSNFRGGRASEAKPFIDGVSIKDVTAGYDIILDESDMQTSFSVPEGSIETMEIITGGFNAEYGNAQSAIINIITKDGGSKHTGRIGVKTSIADQVETRYWGKDPDGNWVYERDEHLQEFFDGAQAAYDALPDSIKADPTLRVPTINEFGTYELNDYQRDEYEFSLNGPVPFTNEKFHYSLNGEIVDRGRTKQSYNLDDFTGSVQAKLTYRISPDYKLQFSGLGSMTDDRRVGFFDAKYPGGYMPGIGEIPAKPVTEEYEEFRNYLGSVKWTHTLSSSTFYEVQASYNYNTYDSKVKDWNDRDGDGDTDEFFEWKMIRVPQNTGDRSNPDWEQDLRYVSDNTKFFWVAGETLSDGTVKEGQWRFGVPGKSAWRQVWVLDPTNYTYTQEWRFLTGTVHEDELTSFPIPEKDESILYPTVPNTAFEYYGDAPGYMVSKNTVLNVRADFTSQVNPQHLVKAGVNFEQTNFEMLNMGFFSFSNIYKDEFDVSPMDISAYIQDKMEFAGMILNAGVRFDYFDPGKDVLYPGSFVDPVDQSVDVGEEGYLLDPQEAEAYKYISPRLGISHPISENTVLHFSYGHFYQRPDYRYWFENTNYDFGGAYGEMGNPTLEPEKTVAYEIGFQHNMGDYLLGFNAFYKDITNLIDQIDGGTPPFEDYWIYDNRDWADVRGFELSLRKFYSNYFSGSINYTYMIAKGKASDTQTGGSELWRKITGVQNAYYLDWDQRHTLNAYVTFSVPQNWGPKIGTFSPLGDWSLNILYTYGSPQPYSPVSRDPQPEYNTERLLATMQTDLKLEKRFAISGNMRAIVYLEGLNVFDRKNLSFFPGSMSDGSDARALVDWVTEHPGEWEGRNKEAYVWGARRSWRVGLGFEF
jgi:outer membrane receptor protein involved in Fe transport